MDDDAKKAAGKQHCERLWNVEFAWSLELHSPANPANGAPTLTMEKMLQTAIKKMKLEKDVALQGL